MLSPTIAPAAAKTMISGSWRSPAPATTPAVMTVASLGTSGKNASMAETAKTSGYVHQAPETHWTNWSKMFTWLRVAAAALLSAARGHLVRRRLELVGQRIERDLGAGRVCERLPEQAVREPRVAREQRAVEVRAVHAAGAAALETGGPVVAEPRDHASERLGALVEVRAACVVLEPGERAAGAGPGAVEQHVADH